MSRIGILVFAWLICWRCCIATEETGLAQEAECNERPFAAFLQNAPSLKQETDATAGQRKRSLTILSATDSGRSYLLRIIPELSDESLQSEIANVLQERVGAVQRTDRYDFISKQDCQRILEALKTRKSQSTQDK